MTEDCPLPCEISLDIQRLTKDEFKLARDYLAEIEENSPSALQVPDPDR